MKKLLITILGSFTILMSSYSYGFGCGCFEESCDGCYDSPSYSVSSYEYGNACSDRSGSCNNRVSSCNNAGGCGNIHKLFDSLW